MKIGSARILILSASNYDFKNDQGEQVVGCKLFYCSGSDELKNPDSAKGSVPVEVSVDRSEWKGLSALPGWYDVDLFMTTEKVTKAGQKTNMQVIKPGNLSYVEALRGPTSPVGPNANANKAPGGGIDR